MNYKIVDETGNTIHTGTEQEMEAAYQIISWDEKALHKMHQEPRLQQLKDKWRVPGIVGKVNVQPI